MKALVALAIACSTAPLMPLAAQGVRSAAADSSVAGIAPARVGAAAAQQPAGAPQNRAALQRQVRQALARLTRQRLGLNDAQMAQLAAVDRQFQPRRQALTRDETQTRRALASAMADTAKPDQAKISGYMDHLAQLQRQRIDLQQDEQKALGGFLTPLQRAQYQALQERVRRRLEQFGPMEGAHRSQPRRPRRPPPR